MVGFSGAAGVRRSWVVVVMAMALVAAVLVLVASSGVAEAATATNGKLATSAYSTTTFDDIWVMDANGTNEANLTSTWVTPDGSPSSERLPAWSPDGTQIALSSTRGTPGSQLQQTIWVMNADGSNPHQVTAPTSGDPDQNSEFWPSWSPDGQWIAFSRGYDGFGPLYKIRYDGTGEATVIDIGPPPFEEGFAQPRWAPDGGVIAYASISGLGNGDIFIVWPNGSSNIPLNPGPDWSMKVRYSPISDGPVVYVRCDAPCNSFVPNVRIMSRSGSGDVLFVADADGPVWSPDGAVILYSKQVGTGPGSAPIYKLFTMPVSGGAATEIPIPFQSSVWNVSADWDWQPVPVPPPPSDQSTGLVDPASGKWYLYDNTGAMTTSFYYGKPGDYPFMGDWDCTGTETPGLYRQSDGYAYLRDSNTQGNGEIKFFFGNPGDVPIAGDFNGDGCDTLSIYRPSNQTFHIINKLGENDGSLGAAEFSYVFGNPGDKPFVGDFDGDGVETVGLHRETTGLVYFRNSHTQGNADAHFIFGNPGDRLIAGDWNNDGKFSPALYRPWNTTMYFRFTNTQGNADAQFVPMPNGAAWLPVAGKR